MAVQRKPVRARKLRLPPVAPVVRIAAVVAAFLLGTYGFAEAHSMHGAGSGPLAGNALKAVRLIVGGFPQDLDGKDLPLSLNIARWALPLLTFWSTIALAWMQVRNAVRMRFIRARGDHLVLAGDGSLAARTALATLEAGRRVLLWPPDARLDWVRDAQEEGAAEVEAKGDDLNVNELGLDKARGVVLLAPEDTANVALASTVMDQAARVRPAGDPLDVIARVDDLDLRRSVEERFARADRSTARIRFASIPDIAARQLFVQWPLDSFQRVGDGQPGESARRVFILGFSPAIERYMLRLLAGGHFRDGGKPRFIVVDRDGKAQEQGFRTRNPGADTLSPVLFEDGKIDQSASAAALIDSLTQRHGEPVAVLVDCQDDARSLAVALAVESRYSRLDQPCPPVHLRLESGQHGNLGVSLFPFGSLDGFSDPELLLQERHDALARAIHDFYLEGRLDEGDIIGSRASMQEWEDLAESFRDDNRLVADCYQLKLRDIGARFAGGSGPTLKLDGDELEELSRAEHDRWMAAKLSTGWRYGPERDDRAKTHPDIIPYDALSERIKDLDREQVRIMTRLLAASGRRALRTLVVALDGSGGTGTAAAMPSILAALSQQYPDRVPVFLGSVVDPATRAALDAARAAGALVQLATRDNIQNLIDRAPAAERSAARALAREADCIFATSGDPAAFAVDRAELVVIGAEGPAPAARPAIRVTTTGAITTAPWAR